MNKLLCIGLGYTAAVLAARLQEQGWRTIASTRFDPVSAAIWTHHVTFQFDSKGPIHPTNFDGVTHVVISAPPGQDGDPVLLHNAAEFAVRARQFQWVGYLSTTGVYGDHGGGWVTEDTPLTPNTERGHRRVEAEAQWLQLWRDHGLPVHIFRLAGIYGEGRNQLLSILDGSAKRIVKPGQVFSRVHVEDIATVLEASIARPHPGRAYNVCDDEACPPQDVVAFAAELLGREPPPEIPYGEATLSPMARSFYADSKRVCNARIRQELGVRLRYPTYREGLRALAEDFMD